MTGIVVELVVNGQRHRMALDPRITLLDLLREHLDLVGTKKGCDHGQCGACTVLVDGRRVVSCLALAATVRGPVTTSRASPPTTVPCTRSSRRSSTTTPTSADTAQPGRS